MSHHRKPNDEEKAQETLRKFSSLAYSFKHKDLFQKAVCILYGPEFKIKPDLSKRMIFHCELCFKDMNSVDSLEGHCRSGTHQKNRDKKARESQGFDYQFVKSDFPQNSLHYKLERSVLRPVGLQMVEEYSRNAGPSYYKCILCGAHGKLNHMYYHIVGNKHTEKYIRSSYKLEGSVLTARERDHLRNKLVKLEGTDVSLIRIIKDKDLYPRKWEAEAHVHVGPKINVKEEPRSPSPPTPGPSNQRPSSNSYISHNHRSPSLESPLRSVKHSLSDSQEVSPLRSVKHPGCDFQEVSPLRSVKHPRYDSREGSPIVHFRNKSPPPPLLPVSLSDPAVKFLSSPEVRDKTTQKFDLEELMVQLNMIVKSDSEIVSASDARDVIDMMSRISNTLLTINTTQIIDFGYKDEEYFRKLSCQKETLRKILAHIKQRLEDSWKRHNIHS